MSTNVKPVEQLEFRGVYTAQNPVQRPRNTAESCQDLRVMPGGYLRLRSGRVKRATGPGGTIRQIAPCRTRDFWGTGTHLIQAGTDWKSMLVDTPSYTVQATIEPISTTYDGAFASSNPVAFAMLNDRPLMYNGLGVRSTTDSKPPFSTWTASGGARFFGLDAFFKGYTTPGVFTPFGIPEMSFDTSAGACNKWLNRISIYMGLWHKPTDHYSNGQYLHHFLIPQTTNVKLLVTSLDRALFATHGSAETAELYFVFYATIDGGSVPYLILNQTLDGPYAVAVTATSTDLSIEPLADVGFVLDLVHEMPLENHPPRPMRSVAFVNGRLYGVLMNGGANHDNLIHGPSLIGGPGGPSVNEFSYVPPIRDLAAVVWSVAVGDFLGSDFLGDPLQSWPYANIAYTPSIEQPLIVAPAQVGSGQVVLVVTNTHSFYLQEQADGIHEWVTISDVHGIGVAATLRATSHGTVWVTQRNQIVLLRPGALTLEILSEEYQNLMAGTPRCADYILDPVESIDRYQVWLDSSIAVCHDFTIAGPGKAYTCTAHDFTAASTTVDASGRPHHVLAKTDFYTHEAQPGGGIRTTDDGAEISGQYTRNWDDFGDSDVRKELPMVDIVGDGIPAASLTNVSPLVVEWYGDFEQVTGANKKTATGSQLTQSTTSSTFRYKLAAANKFWYKLVFKLAGHSTENGGTTSSYPAVAGEGNAAYNFYGSILRALWRLGVGENRA